MKLPIYLLTLHQMNYLNYLTTISQPIEDVCQTLKPFNVQLIVHSSFANGSEIIDIIYNIVSRIVPTSYVSLNNSMPEESPFFRPFDRTLIVYVYASKNSPDPQQRENIIRIVTFRDNRPKVLLITVLEERNCNFEPLFKQMWLKHLIDATILELPEFDGQSIAIKVHQYNPFTNVYDQQPYVSGIQWFPNKMTNLRGYPLKVFRLNLPDYSWLKTNAQWDSLVFKGPEAKTVKTIARVMNFTITKFIETDWYDFRGFLSSGKIDILLPMLPFFPNMYSTVGHTLPLRFENWCPIVPITYRYRKFEIRGFIGIMISYCFVFVFWLVSLVFKFDSRTWKPIKIFGLIISVSTPMKLRNTTERLILLNILLVSAMYSANLFVDLTTARLKGKTEMNYESFEELDESGLIPVVYAPLFNLTFLTDDKSLLALKRKTIVMNITNDCIVYLAKYRNISCFIESTFAISAFQMYSDKDKPAMKVCKNLCYAKPPVGYILAKHLPYKDRFVDIIIRLDVTGIQNRWYQDFSREFRPRNAHLMKGDDTNQSSLSWNLIYITGCGYLLSFLILLGEIFVHRVYNDEKEKNF